MLDMRFMGMGMGMDMGVGMRQGMGLGEETVGRVLILWTCRGVVGGVWEGGMGGRGIVGVVLEVEGRMWMRGGRVC